MVERDIPIPKHIDMYLLDKEIAASDMTALEAVATVDEEKVLTTGLGRQGLLKQQCHSTPVKPVNTDSHTY